jgi:hypothetical protein
MVTDVRKEDPEVKRWREGCVCMSGRILERKSQKVVLVPRPA